MIICMVAVTYISFASAFFMRWGSSEPTKPPQTQYGQWPVTAYYQQRLLQAGDSNPSAIPAIPIQVPLQAQLSPASHIHNVQLVPCLCPVSQDYEYDKAPGGGGSMFLNQIGTKPQEMKP